MQLVKWNPMRDMLSFNNRADRIFNDFFYPSRGMQMSKDSSWNPRVDISESDKGYEVRADIPGVRKEDLKVTLQHGVLTVQGERHQEKKEDNERLHRVERSYGSFSRSFRLPDDADASAMSASAKEGQLTVTVPRKRPSP